MKKKDYNLYKSFPLAAMFEYVLSSYGRTPVYTEKTHLLD